MSKVRVLAVALLALLSVFVVGAVSAQDTKEVNIALPKLLDGDVVENSFSGRVTTHIYWFNGSAGDKVIIDMTQAEDSPDLDPFLVLLGAAGELIAMDDDSGAGALFAASIMTELPADGGYFIVASSFDYIDLIIPESEGIVGLELAQNYTLSVDGITPPVNMPNFDPDMITFYRSEVAYGETLNGYSSQTEPVYYVTFIAEEGDIIDIDLESNDFDTLLYLIGNNGERLAANDDRAQGDLNSGIYGFEVPMSGKYLLFATDIGFYNANEAPDPESVLSYTGGEFTLVVRKR